MDPKGPWRDVTHLLILLFIYLFFSKTKSKVDKAVAITDDFKVTYL